MACMAKFHVINSTCVERRPAGQVSREALRARGPARARLACTHDGLGAVHGRADGEAGEARLGDGRVNDAVAAVLLVQAARDLVRALVLADLLACARSGERGGAALTAAARKKGKTARTKRRGARPRRGARAHR